MEYTDQLERIYADWQSQTLQRAVVAGYEARFGGMSDELREVLGRVHGESALLELIAILTTRAHEEVVAAMHQAASAT